MPTPPSLFKLRRAGRYIWPLVSLLCVLGALIFLNLRPYGWNVSAFFHSDETMAQSWGVPAGFVTLSVPGYDGEQYYQIARHMGMMIDPTLWPSLAGHPTIAYSYQRFLLPLAAYILALGQTALLPYTFLLIQILSLVSVCLLMTSLHPRKPLYALALALCPAAMIGLHFSLAEPLTLALLTAFLVRFVNRTKLVTVDILLLSLFVLTREVNILFIGLLLLYLLAKRRWQDCFLLIIPFTTFLALHTLIFKIFGTMPFFWSTEKHALPFTAIIDILSGLKGYNAYTLSSIALFLGFVLPGFFWSVWNIKKKTERLFLPLFSTLFLGLMLVMPDHIWGSITSIGRVITPVYPLFLLLAAERDTLPARLIALAILALGLGIGIALALMPHPFTLA